MSLIAATAEHYLPESFKGIEPDWALTCADGEELPCHSVILAALSPVLEGLLETRPREDDGKVALPFRISNGDLLDHQLGACFLHWAYRNVVPGLLSASNARKLAALSHEWQLPGLAHPCDAVLSRLVRNAHASVCSVPEALILAGEELFDLACLAARCGLHETLARCEHAIIAQFVELGPDPRVSLLPAASVQRIALGAFAGAMAGKSGFTCHECGSTTSFHRDYQDDLVCSSCKAMVRRDVALLDVTWLRRPLQPVTLEHLREWAWRGASPSAEPLLLPRRRAPRN